MAAVWSRLGASSRSVQSVQALTEAAPVAESDGFDLTGIGSILPVLKAPNGETLTGSGFLRSYYYSRQLSLWLPVPLLDEELTDYAGKLYVTLQSVPIVHPDGKLALIADGVGVTGGAQVTVYILSTDRKTGWQV
jgi:hypothetical protein